jgi:glycyl-tRNA synthetase
MTNELQPRVSMDEIAALAKRRGFIFQSSEIYGGIGGFFDYGPLGAVLKRNVKDAWWREMVELRDDVVAFDSSIIMHPNTWVASGHVAAFHDKLVDCTNCKHRFRADHLPSLDKCPDCGMRDTLTEPRNFNLMMQTSDRPDGRFRFARVPAPGDRSGHLRQFQEHLSERAQEAALRHRADREVVPQRDHARQLHLSVREFEQAELEYFVPDDGKDMACYDEWVAARKKWYSDYGVREDRLRFYELRPEERPHYAKAGVDVEYLFPWGWGELESIAHRGTYDLDAHMKLSGKDLTYFDEATKSKYTPILIESSAGMDRTTLTMLVDAYDSRYRARRSRQGVERASCCASIRRSPRCRSGVFPLARNKPELVERARAIEADLRPHARTQYDEGNVGQLYRRQDEIGTPFCIMVDYQTLDDTTVTVRDRDSMRQERVGASGLRAYLAEKL